MILDEYIKLFSGLEDGYGEEENGKIINRKNPVKKLIFKQHLAGKRKIGIYPLKRNNSLNWACLDFDGEGSKEKARKIFEITKKFNIIPSPEISSSGEGMHLWFFFKNPTSGWKARKFLSTLLGLGDLKDDEKIEIFPKQDFLPDKGWGNFVFLPLQGNLVKEKKTILLDWPKNHFDLPSLKIDKETLDKLVPSRLSPKRKQIKLGEKTAEEILEYFEIKLSRMEKKGEEIWALCPFHSETDPSFSIHNEELVYYCFGCNAKGYIDSLVEHLTGESFILLAREERVREEEERIYGNRDGEEIEIADFGFEIKRIYREEEGEIKREIAFHQKSKNTISLAIGQEVSTKQNFSTFALSHGTFHFTGTESEFKRLLKEKDTEAATKGICRIERKFGFHTENIFMTKNFIINNKEIFYPDEEEIFTFENKNFKIEVDETLKNFYPFSLTLKENFETPKRNKTSLLKAFQKTYPIFPIEIALGWIFASIYSTEIKNSYGFFPILSLVGPNSTGKTCLARNLLGIWGMESILSIGKGSTYTGTKRVLGSVTGTPICIDDYRNIPTYQEKDDLFRSGFDGIAGFKGKKEQGKVYQEISTASLLLTGEELPEDLGLRSRCLVLRFGTLDHKTNNAFQELEGTILEYSPLTIKEIRSKTPNSWEKLEKEIEKYTKVYFKLLNHSRQARIWAIPTATFFHSFKIKPNLTKFKSYLTSAKEEQKTREEEDIVSNFFSGLDILLLRDQIREGEQFEIENDRLYLRIRDCYYKWTEFLGRSRTSIPGFIRLRTELSGKKFVLSLAKLKRFRGQQKRFIEIDLKTIPPDLVPEFLSKLEEKE